MIELAFRLAERAGLASAAFRGTGSQLRILCYHGIWDSPGRPFGDTLFMTAARFEQRLRTLKALGCEVLPLSVALAALRSGQLPPRAVAITIDDGWASTFRVMVPALKSLGFPATLYMRTDKMDDGTPICPVAVRHALERATVRSIDAAAMKRLLATSPLAAEIDPGAVALADPNAMMDKIVEIGRLIEAMGGTAIDAALDQFHGLLGVAYAPLQARRSFSLGTAAELRQAAGEGIDVQLHTHRHYLGDLTGEWVLREVADNRRVLAEALRVPQERFTHFCYPSGRYSPGLYPVLEGLGIESATTTDFGLASTASHPMALPRILDGEQVSDARFVAQVSGLKSLLRRP